MAEGRSAQRSGSGRRRRDPPGSAEQDMHGLCALRRRFVWRARQRLRLHQSASVGPPSQHHRCHSRRRWLEANHAGRPVCRHGRQILASHAGATGLAHPPPSGSREVHRRPFATRRACRQRGVSRPASPCSCTCCMGRRLPSPLCVATRPYLRRSLRRHGRSLRPRPADARDPSVDLGSRPRLAGFRTLSRTPCQGGHRGHGPVAHVGRR